MRLLGIKSLGKSVKEEQQDVGIVSVRYIPSESDEDPAFNHNLEVIQASCVEKAVERFRKSMEERVSIILSALSFSSTPFWKHYILGFPTRSSTSTIMILPSNI